MIIHNQNRIWFSKVVHRFEVEENTIEFAESSREVGMSIVVLLDFLLSVSDVTYGFSRVVFVTVTFPLNQVLDMSLYQLSI